MDVLGRLVAEQSDFTARLHEIKQETPLPQYAWYPYDTMANIRHLDRLFAGRDASLFDAVSPDQKVLDIGAADGDLAFFLEHLGFNVDIVDYHQSNYNHLLGVKTMKERLRSQVRIIDVDIDSQFSLPSEYQIVFAFGLLYHLQNPFFFLKKLALHCEWCILSTRIASFAADGTTEIRNQALAYLLDPTESNNDATNFWVFSAAGLRRLFERSGWVLQAWNQVGATGRSTPHRPDQDERVFVLARRREGVEQYLQYHVL